MLNKWNMPLCASPCPRCYSSSSSSSARGCLQETKAISVSMRRLSTLTLSRSACFIMYKLIGISPNHSCTHYIRLCRNSCSSGIGSLVGLCRWLRLGPLLDPAIMHAVSLFGCYLRQGHCSLPTAFEGTAESYTKQVYFCWKYWQQQLAPEEIRLLVGILNQSQDPSQAVRRFQESFKQFAIAKEIEGTVSHLSNRVASNGWPFEPSFDS